MSYPSIEDFEEVVNKTSTFLECQYRNMYVLKDEIDRVRNNKAEYCIAPVTGSDYCSWYFYHTMDDRLVFIIESLANEDKQWTWQYGVPPELEVHIVDGPPRLIRSCTRYDCHCLNEVMRPVLHMKCVLDVIIHSKITLVIF